MDPPLDSSSYNVTVTMSSKTWAWEFLLWRSEMNPTRVHKDEGSIWPGSVG